MQRGMSSAELRVISYGTEWPVGTDMQVGLERRHSFRTVR